MTEQAAKKLTGAAALAATAKANAGRLAVLSAGLVERGYATEGEDLDPVAIALAKLDDLAGEAKQLKRKVTAQQGVATRARNQAAALEAQMPDKPRAIGPIKKPLSPRELLELIAGAESVEVAFSDGRAEILELRPREIAGGKAAFTVSSRGLLLTVPEFEVNGPRAGERPYLLAGYGLFVDGELAAYGPRSETLKIAAGARYNLKGDPVF